MEVTIDISKIKPGDKVTLVPLEVDCIEDGRVYLRHQKSFLWLNTDQIAAHHPAPREIGVGDRVFMTDRGRDHAGTVRGVDMPDLWVRWDATFMYRPICRAADLTLVEGGE